MFCGEVLIRRENSLLVIPFSSRCWRICLPMCSSVVVVDFLDMVVSVDGETKSPPYYKRAFYYLKKSFLSIYY
jgi:hypothetical protein